MNISVDLVKQLRDLTMASLKDCKDCLEEAEGDIEKAKELLKKKWLASALKKGDRETKEGKIGNLVKDGKLAIVKLGCETDFVAKNEIFDSLIESILNNVIETETQSFEVLDDAKKEELNTMVAEVEQLWGKYENCRVIREEIA